MRRLKHIFIVLLALPALVSCDKDTLLPDGGQDQPVMLAVTLDERPMSRAAIGADKLDGENYIIKGDYSIFLDLPDGLGLPNAHCCRFPDSRNGLIYPVSREGDTGEPSASPLKWSDERMQNKKEFDFILDNIGYVEECTKDETSMFLGREWTDEEKTKTYGAQQEAYREDKTPVHTNDIIWGRGTARYGTDGKTASVVELTHRMTRINVVCVDLDKMTEEQRNGMTISITNLVLSAESFNRYDGTVAIAEKPVREALILKGVGDVLIPSQDNTTNADNYVEYDTPNFILPPQPLDNENWPRVFVAYTASDGTEKKVSGLVPHEILNESNSWEALDALQAGNHLTIVVQIKEGIPDIIFTAKVKKWVEIGPMTVTATQHTPGINSKEELEECIRLYNQLPVFDTGLNPANMQDKLNAVDEKLLLYGKCEKVNGALRWTFPINFKLEDGYSPKTGFRYIMWATATDETYAFSYPLILTGEQGNQLESLKGEKGIYNIEDLNAMIAFVNRQYGFEYYGDYDDGSSTYTFNLRANITGEVLNKITTGVNFVMNANGFTVNGSADVNNLIGGK